jgi:hypothetical protein
VPFVFLGGSDIAVAAAGGHGCEDVFLKGISVKFRNLSGT